MKINRKNIRAVKSILLGGHRYSSAKAASEAYVFEQCYAWWLNHLMVTGKDPEMSRRERERKMYKRVLPIFTKMIE